MISNVAINASNKFLGISPKKCNNQSINNNKTQDKTGSLNALASYGRAQLNIPFKGGKINVSSEDNTEFHELNELTDREFEQMKKNVQAKYNALPPEVRTEFELPKLTKFNIFVANKLVSQQNQKKIIYIYGEDIIQATKSPEQAQVASKLLDLNLTAYNIHGILQNSRGIVSTTNTPEQAEVKCNIIDRILSDEQLYKNGTVMSYAYNLIHCTNTPYQEEVTEKFLSDEKLYSNFDVMCEAADIIFDTLSAKEAKETIAYLDKILSD